jgi:arginine utilization regulatory protein
MPNIRQDIFGVFGGIRMTQEIETIEMLQAILSSIDEGIHVINASGETIYYNHVIAELDSLAEEEVIGKHILDVFPSLDSHTSTLLQVIQSGKPIVNQPQTYTNMKGKQVDTVNTTLPIYVAGKIVGAVEVAKNISKVKQLSEKLLELQEKVHSTSKPEKGAMSRKRTKEYFEIEDFITQDEAMTQMKRTILRIAKTDSPVLVNGETGTGKEIVVQSIHSASSRKRAPFIAQNCAALPSSLLESLLFGTTKGSFTGSMDRAGLFELADGGTLFLDEINSMPIELQAKLLRVLQEGMVRRIGGSKTYPVSIKVIAASNEEPWEAVKEGRLRSDLYYRLHVVSLSITPLRERKSDIPLLVEHFIGIYSERFGRRKCRLDPIVLQKMMAYHWPGNVRELEHSIEAAMNMIDGELLREEDFPESLRRHWSVVNSETTKEAKQDSIMASKVELKVDPNTIPTSVQNTNSTLVVGHSFTKYLGSLKTHLEEEEKRWIEQALRSTEGNIKQAADELQIPRQTLQYKLKKYGIIYDL